MPITSNVIATLDERAARQAADQLVRYMSEAGTRSAAGFSHSFTGAARFGSEGRSTGAKFGENLASGVKEGFHAADFDSITGVLHTSTALAKATSSGGMLGAAFAGGVAAAAVAGIAAAAVEIGEAFEQINRGVTLSVNQSGSALDELKNRADRLAGSLDTSTKSLGADFGMLASRLGDASPALETITGHVEMLRDRVGSFNLSQLSGAFVQFGLNANQADEALASITQSGVAAGGVTADLFNAIGANVPTLKETGLGLEQIGHFLGDLETKGIPATKAVAGLEFAEKAAAKQGEDLATFLPRVIDSIQHYIAIGDSADAQRMAVDVFGPRRWAESKAIIDDLSSTMHALPGAFNAPAKYLDDLGEKTRNLHNQFELLRNKVEATLAPTGLDVVEKVSKEMDHLGEWLAAHQEDMRKFFETSVNVIGDVVKGIGEIAAFLGRYPGLIQAAATAFDAWESMKFVDFVLTGLESIGAWLIGAPAVAEASAAGVGVAMTGMAATTTAAGAEMGLAFGPIMAELPTIATEAEVTGGAIVTSMTAADGAIVALNASLDTALASFTALAAGAAPVAAVLAAVGAFYGISIAKGSATGQEPETGPGWSTGPDGKPWTGPGPKAGAPPPGAPPLPAGQKWWGYTGTGKPGETPALDPGARRLSTAFDQLPLLTPDQLEASKGGAPKLPKPPVVPFNTSLPPGFQNLPMSSSLYSAESSYMKDNTDLAEKRARLDQLEHSNTATEQDILKARNDVAEAARTQQQSELRLYEARNEIFAKQNKQLKGLLGDLGEIGAGLDKDFGISKGLSGIAENITKFVLNLAAAPLMAQLGVGQIAAGYKPGEAGSGLMSAIAAGGAFGPQYQLTPFASFDKGAGAAAGPAAAGLTDTNAAASAYGGDAALLAHVPAGRYDASGDLSKGLGDCSSAVEDLVNILDGNPTAGRGMSTANAPEWLTAHGFLPTNAPVPGSFQVGFNQQHMQATLPGGTNFNWGSDSAAQNRGIGGTGAWDPGFTQHYYRAAGAGGAGGPMTSAGSGDVVNVFVTNMPGTGLPGAPGGGAPGAAPAAPGAPSAGSGAPGTPHPGATPSPAGGKPVGPGTATRWITNVDGSQKGLDAAGNATGDYIPAGGAPMPGAAPGGGVPPGTPLPGAPVPGATPFVPSGYGPGAPLPGLPDTSNLTRIGGAPMPAGQGSGFNPGGGAFGMAAGAAGGMGGMMPGGQVASVGMQTAMKLGERAIGEAGQLVGIGVKGLKETFSPAGSDLAANTWVTKIAGGLAGAHPQLPNLAGKGDESKPKAEHVLGNGKNGGAAGAGGQGAQGGTGGDDNRSYHSNVTVNPSPNHDEEDVGRAAAEHTRKMWST